MKKLIAIFVFGMGFTLTSPSLNQAQNSVQAVFTNAATQASAGGKSLSASLGQTFQGVSGASSKNIGSGYWYTITQSAVSTDLETLDTNPSSFALFANYPNPFNPETTFNFNLSKSGSASLVIYDMLGNVVETIVDQELPAGEFRTTWDATGRASGIYLYRLEANGKIATRKMTLMK